eukprot:RCo049305
MACRSSASLRGLGAVLVLLCCFSFCGADTCPGFQDCSGNGRCITRPTGGELVVIGCQCFDDDYNGHFTGRFCNKCSTGYKGLRCDVSFWPLPPDLAWVLLLFLSLSIAGCVGACMVKLLLDACSWLLGGDRGEAAEDADEEAQRAGGRGGRVPNPIL